MADIVMPQLGESVTEGTITRWFKAVGEAVTEDEPLFEVSTDKVDTEVPAPASGVLSEIRVEEGDTVEVGTVLAVVGDAASAPAEDRQGAAEPEAAAAPEPASQSVPEAPQPSGPPPSPAPQPAPQPAPAPQPPPAPAPPPSPAPEPAASGNGSGQQAPGQLLSPLVRRLVEEHQLDPSQITGTGVGGRITREDVLAVIDGRAEAGRDAASPQSSAQAAPAVAPQPAPAAPSSTGPSPARTAAPPVPTVEPGAGDRVEQLNNIRRLTGEAMVASKAAAPHAITAMQVDYEAVERARRAKRDDFRSDEGFALTYLPFVSRAVVDALAEFPRMNASMGEGSVVLHTEVHLSIAVDLEFQGLLAPVVRDAHDKRLRAIARDIRDLADRARSKRLSPDELSGGTFTISNSGSYGTLMVVPIINQPQVAILSTDGVARQPVVVTDEHGNESLGIHSVGNLTLSWDHRAFDGAYAAAFMARVKEIIETRDWSTEL
jgi:pyruvate dehydrogenase E2 component (dihydrolipoamide acetyltransferase)